MPLPRPHAFYFPPFFSTRTPKVTHSRVPTPEFLMAVLPHTLFLFPSFVTTNDNKKHEYGHKKAHTVKSKPRSLYGRPIPSESRL